jgi:hypothetical protein
VDDLRRMGTIIAANVNEEDRALLRVIFPAGF